MKYIQKIISLITILSFLSIPAGIIKVIITGTGWKISLVGIVVMVTAVIAGGFCEYARKQVKMKGS